jgi:glucose/arabinose dehydrogenase
MRSTRKKCQRNRPILAKQTHMQVRIRASIGLFSLIPALLAVSSCERSVLQPQYADLAAAAATLQPYEWMYTDAPPGTTLRTRVILRDASGVPIPNARIRWSVLEGGGSFAALVSRTDASGIAEQDWTLGPVGPQRAMAKTPDIPGARFEANSFVGDITLDTIVSGLQKPIYLTAPPGDDRLFVVEEGGTIRIIRDGVVRRTPFLDLRCCVSIGGEQGLLSMAFHPNFATNGFFFVNYTDLAGHTRIERYHVPHGSNTADPASAKLILYIEQPYANHNGGHLMFAPDGKLLIPMGDGGSGGDPLGNGQNKATLLGKLLRINIDVQRPYVSPRNNPFVDDTAARPEIWALGLRNPWRIAIDNGLLYIADVGQGRIEEINVVPVTKPGVNYGWNIVEGSRCRVGPTCSKTGLTLPLVEYTHDQGCAVTGGFVYRGSELPEITGTYFYADFCSGWIRSFRYDSGRAIQARQWDKLGVIGQPASFGVDGFGELYVLSRFGHVLRFSRKSP